MITINIFAYLKINLDIDSSSIGSAIFGNFPVKSSFQLNSAYLSEFKTMAGLPRRIIKVTILCDALELIDR